MLTYLVKVTDEMVEAATKRCNQALTSGLTKHAAMRRALEVALEGAPPTVDKALEVASTKGDELQTARCALRDIVELCKRLNSTSGPGIDSLLAIANNGIKFSTPET